VTLITVSSSASTSGKRAEPGGGRRRRGARSASLRPDSGLPRILNGYGPRPTGKGRLASQRAHPARQSLAHHVLATPGFRLHRGHRIAHRPQLDGERGARRSLISRPHRFSWRHESGGFGRGTREQGPCAPSIFVFPAAETGAFTASEHDTSSCCWEGAGLRSRGCDAPPFVPAVLVPGRQDAPFHGARCLQRRAAVPFQYGHQVRFGGHCL
jgi:hypothetical protein